MHRTWAQQCRVNHVRSIGSSYQEHAQAALNAVHLCQ